MPGIDFDSLSSSPIRDGGHGHSQESSESNTRRLQARIAALEELVNQRPNTTPLRRGRTPMDLSGLAPRTASNAPTTRTVDGRLPLGEIPATMTNISQPPDRRKIKCAEPPVFTGPPMDVRLWIIDMNDFFNLQVIEGPAIQASTACTYLGQKIRTRTQLMRLQGQRETFEDWERLQVWLLENYSVGDVQLDAELKMERIRMRWNESVQDFINRFETLATDLTWNDAAICHAFRRKLSAEILERIHQSRSELPDTFTAFKKAAQAAESHIKIGKRTLEDREGWEQRGQKKVRFANSNRQPLSNDTNQGQPQINPFRPTSPNSRKRADITAEERKRRRNKGLYIYYGEKGH